MTPTFPFSLSYLPAALRPPSGAIGVAGFGHYSAAATPASSQLNTRHVQLLTSTESRAVHTSTGRSRRSSGGSDRHIQTMDDSEHHHRSSTGSKNGVVSAETYSPRAHVHSPSKATCGASVREVSAESRYVAESSDDSIRRVTESSGSDEYVYSVRATKRQRSNDGNDDNDDEEEDRYSISRTTTEKRPKVFDRYNRNGIVSVEKNASKKHLLSAAPPLLKVIDLEADGADTLPGEKWSEDQQRFSVCERDQHQHEYRYHQCTLPPPPALRNAEVISTVIKHIQPRGEIMSSSIVTAEVGYSDREKDFECCSGLEDSRCRGGGGEQRCRMSNSLSSSDEGPDSPLSQAKFDGSGESTTYCYNKVIGRDGVYLQVASKHSSSPSTGVSHKNSQYRSLRKKKNAFHRPNHHHHHNNIVLQHTT